MKRWKSTDTWGYWLRTLVNKRRLRKNKKSVLYNKGKASRNLVLPQKSSQSENILGINPWKILGTILKIYEGRTLRKRPKDNEIDDYEQGIVINFPRDVIVRLYESRKEGGGELACIGHCVDASISDSRIISRRPKND